MSIKVEKPEEDESEIAGVTFTEPTDDWRAVRRRERRERRTAPHAARQSGLYTWVGGAVLILLGAIFWLQNMGVITHFANWWALVLLIPAVGEFATAWNLYRKAGQQWTSATTRSLIGGSVLLLLAAAFLLNLNWGLLWPLVLVVAGLAMLLGHRWQ